MNFQTITSMMRRWDFRLRFLIRNPAGQLERMHLGLEVALY